MSNVANRAVISIELDHNSLDKDGPKAAAVFADFMKQMQKSANIIPTIDLEELKRSKRLILKVDVDPESATAGLEVIRNHVKEFASKMRREGKITVGVDTQPVTTAFTRLKAFAIHNAKSIGDGIHFWISRGLLKAGRDMALVLPRFFAASFEKALEAEESTKKLAKALGATGEQAGKGQDELQAYARELEKLTNVANEAVQGVQALLLPSKGLSGVNFDRATKGALDLAAALGGDINSHAERLSKSLQDPVRGMEMLRDAGISFSQEQQDIIKLFSETNRVGDAQGIMLDELENRYLGAADSTGDLSDKVEQAKLHYENFKERIGEVVLEVKSEFIPAIDAAMGRLDEMTPVAAGAATAMANIAISILQLRDTTDAAAMSVDEIALKTSEWASALEAAYSSAGGFTDNALSNLSDYLILLAQTPGLTAVALNNMFGDASMSTSDITGGADGFTADMFGSKARSAKRAEEIEQAAIDRRAKQKKQDLLDAEQRKADALKRRADQEAEIALGTGLVTQKDIDEKGSKQAIKDAKEKQKQERKDLLAQKAADEKAASDKERADRKAAKDLEDADNKADREAKRAERELVARQAKEAREKEKAEKAQYRSYGRAQDESERAHQKAQADYEKSLGKDSLLALHDRIQDATRTRANQYVFSGTTLASATEYSGEDGEQKTRAQRKAEREAAIRAARRAAVERRKQKNSLSEPLPNLMQLIPGLELESPSIPPIFVPEGAPGAAQGKEQKIELKQDQVVKAVDGTSEAINEMSTKVVRAIESQQRMGT